MNRRSATARVLPAALLGAWLALAGGPVAAAGPPPAGCTYRVTQLDATAENLSVTLRCPALDTVILSGRRSFRADALEAVEPLEGTELARFGNAWRLTGGTGGVAARYRFALGDLARRADDADVAQRYGGSVIALLPVWLLPPAADALTLDIVAEGPPGAGFVAALERVGEAHRIVSGHVWHAGYVQFGRHRSHVVQLPGPAGSPPGATARLTVAVADGRLERTDEEIVRWVEASARILAAHAGGYPSARVLVNVLPQAGRGGVVFGRVIGGGGPSVIVLVGEHSAPVQLYRHWILVHELIHTGTPFVHDRGGWLMEGFATYAEPVLRARAGWITPEAVWAEFAGGMPRGLDAMGPGGLGRTRGGGGVYWGGALFMLLADVGLRQATGGAFGLDDCLAALAAAGATPARRWTVDATLATCDRASGTRVMADLADRHRAGTEPMALERLWRDLGVEPAGEGVVLRDDAPLAAIRRAITAPFVPPPVPLPDPLR